jgi:hypothetical protein
MRTHQGHTATRRKPIVPDSVLWEMLEDQKRTLRAWGVTIPDDQELFESGTALSRKVQLFDYMIREAIESDFV